MAMNPGMQRGVDREIRKAGQLHGQQRRDYKTAQEAGRGKSFMRRFQNEAGQLQQGIAKEAGEMGYQPQQQQPRPQQQQQRPWSPGGQQGGDMLQNFVNSGGQPMRPLVGGSGQQIDPGRNNWFDQISKGTPVPAQDPNDPNKYERLPNGQVIGTLMGWPGHGMPAGASVQGYPGVVNDMLKGGVNYPMQKPGMAQGFGGRRPWAPNQRSQTRSPGIGLDGQRINYSR